MSTEERVTAPFPSSFDRDLENARVLIEDSPWKENPQKYRKVAEAILRRILRFDPANESAKRLLEKAVEIPIPVAARESSVPPKTAEIPFQPRQDPFPAPQPIPAQPPAPPPSPAPAPAAKMDVPMVQPPPPRRPLSEPNFSFVIDGRSSVRKESTRRPPWVLITLAALGAVVGVALLVTNRSSITSGYSAKTQAAPPTVVQASSTAVPREAATRPAVTSAPEIPEPPPPPAEPSRSIQPAQPVAPPAPVTVKSNVGPVAAVETGTLAVSSPTTVDIYRNDQLVGSAPTTLVLPAGNQTLEYRHQDMRKTVTHTIKANDTTTAMITFDVTVQINAKPWAQVFIDGSTRQSLGQTPLSDVRVPIGSNLVFQNPNFPEKSHRVTGTETQIRMSFP